VGSIIGIDREKQIIRIMTKKGLVSLKVTEDSELLIPGERPESLLDTDPNEFEKESKGRMVRIASRNGEIDHIEPAQ
jgi:polyphosphate kinase